MREYFIICLVSIMATFILDRILKTYLYQKYKFWLFQLIAVILTTLVDNYSSGKPIVTFNENVILNIRILSVPIENYLFGFSLLTLNLILFEYFKRR